MRLFWTLVCWAVFILGICFLVYAPFACAAPLPPIPNPLHALEAQRPADLEQVACEVEEQMLLNQLGMNVQPIESDGLDRLLEFLRGGDLGEVENGWYAEASGIVNVILVDGSCVTTRLVMASDTFERATAPPH